MEIQSQKILPPKPHSHFKARLSLTIYIAHCSIMRFWLCKQHTQLKWKKIKLLLFIQLGLLNQFLQQRRWFNSFIILWISLLVFICKTEMNPVSVSVSSIWADFTKSQTAVKQKHNSLTWDHWDFWESQSVVAEDQEQPLDQKFLTWIQHLLQNMKMLKLWVSN